MFVNGTFVVVSLLPGWLQALGLALPTTYGITVIRAVVLEERSLGTLMMNGSLPLLIGHSTAYFVGGWVFYTWCERVARRQGTLGQY